MATNLNVTELDFADIKNNLKNFLKQQSEFNDYDFEGSGLNVLLDVLAYNTHYNALNAHYSLNESFLDSAQIRGNVVTRSKTRVPQSFLNTYNIRFTKRYKIKYCSRWRRISICSIRNSTSNFSWFNLYI